MIKLLIVEDEQAISDLIVMNLTRAGYKCTALYNGKDAADLLEENQNFDLILLDIMLPEINGYELMEYIRPMGIPVIFITAMASLDNRIKGLTSGAEDYIVKPFEIVELLARINIVLRRYNKTDTILEYKDLVIDTENRIVTRANEEIKLTPKEFDLFVLFVRNKNITLFKDKIFETIWESEWQPESRTVDLHVQRLRKKLDLKNDLKTAYSTGYRLSE
ncbi:DNA-binding response regulator, OmpR family, contains REC and winged-helix (wHTH) domain [Lachnospiraceae bacterium]|nr:DNA-binding response regulator, OmpR family, contains REC and winged-helix (wHTH) domain [Lachnospiraceae bacterium]